MHPHPPISYLFPYTTLFRSNGGCCLIQYKQPGIGYNCPGKGNELLLSGRQPAASFAYLGIISFLRAVVANPRDRKSTRLNSSHVRISYAVFCLKKKTKIL